MKTARMTDRLADCGVPFVLIIVFVALLILSGCTATPTQRWATARDALTTAQDSVSLLHETGNISDETLVLEVDPAIQAARAALDRAESLLPDGDGIGAFLDIAEAAILRLASVRRSYTEPIE